MSDVQVPTRCPACGTEVAPGLLNCPACRRLAHAEELKRLAATAEAAHAAGDVTGALQAWREALDLLPPDSRQHEAVRAKAQELSGILEKSGGASAVASGAASGAAGGAKRGGWKAPAGLAGIGLLIWKIKWLALIALSKGKLLLLGLTKGGTLLTMLASMGVYWAAWGWKLALGLVVSIYIHEMGHVAALWR